MSSRLLARAVSIALHPLVVFLLATPMWRTALGIALVVVIPFTLFMLWQVRTGRWENVDASRPSERPAMFVVALALMGVLAILSRGNPSMLRGVAGAAALFVVAWLLLRWMKVSIHLACASMASVTLLLHTMPQLGIALALLLPLLGWARITLKRHTPTEIIVGALLGAAAGWAVVAV